MPLCVENIEKEKENLRGSRGRAKKCHTLKTQIGVRPDGTIVAVSDSVHGGASHDLTLLLRVMREESLLVAVKRYVSPKVKRHEFSRYPNLIKGTVAASADQIWASDFTYIRLQKERVYLAVILDLFTRSIRGWHLSRDMTEVLVTAALHNALSSHSPPRIHHSDQGVQYCATGYVALLQERGVAVSMSAAGCPTEDAFVERVIRTLKEKEVALNDYVDFFDAQNRLGTFLDEVYNTKRIPSAMGNKTPSEYEAGMRAKAEGGT